MSDSLFLLATAYRIVYGVAGSYLIARLAPDRPMQHALVGGAIGLLVSIVGVLATWNHQPPLGPHWYSLALAITALPCAWFGRQPSPDAVAGAIATALNGRIWMRCRKT